VEVPQGYRELSFVCLRPDGAIETPGTVGIMCRQAKKKVPGLDDKNQPKFKRKKIRNFWLTF
jgi:hypothetical protein